MKFPNLLYILFPIPYCMGFSPTAISYLTVTRVGSCLDRKPAELVYVSEMSLYKKKFDFSFSGEISISADIENGWTVLTTMQKCHDIRNLDTCDFHKSMPIVKQGCLESDEADVYNMFFQYVTPKLECPVRAGNYTINGFPFFTEGSDLTAANSKISTSVFGYTYRLEGFNENGDKLLCVEAHLRLNYVRHHDWTGGGGGTITGRTTPPAPAKDDDDEEAENRRDDDKERDDDGDED